MMTQPARTAAIERPSSPDDVQLHEGETLPPGTRVIAHLGQAKASVFLAHHKRYDVLQLSELLEKKLRAAAWRLGATDVIGVRGDYETGVVIEEIVGALLSMDGTAARLERRCP